jgi:hypothetical protein
MSGPLLPLALQPKPPIQPFVVGQVEVQFDLDVFYPPKPADEDKVVILPEALAHEPDSIAPLHAATSRRQ